MRFLFLFLTFIFSSAIAEENINVALDKCRAKTVTDEAYLCISDKKEQLKQEYEIEFKKLLIKVKKEKKYVMNFNDLNSSLLNSKKSWDKWVKLECLTEANTNEKDTKYYYSVYDTCLVEHYAQRIDHYHKFNFM